MPNIGTEYKRAQFLFWLHYTDDRLAGAYVLPGNLTLMYLLHSTINEHTNEWSISSW